MNAASLSTPPDFLKLLAHDLRWGLVTALSRSDHRVHELMRLLDQPMNLVSYHLKQLRDHWDIALWTGDGEDGRLVGVAQNEQGGHDPARYNLFSIQRLGSAWQCTMREYGFQRLGTDIVLRLSVRIY